jgi:hypothetical protein
LGQLVQKLYKIRKKTVYISYFSPLWVARNASECEEEDRELLKYCRLSCRICGNFTVEVPELDESIDSGNIAFATKDIFDE